MLAVCLLACVVPTRRALRVQPIVAMRVDLADVAEVGGSNPPGAVEPNDWPRNRFGSAAVSHRPSVRCRKDVGGPSVSTWIVARSPLIT